MSFTFDDFPRSALVIGGSILKESGHSATYYTSFGLMGRHDVGGKLFLPEDIDRVLEEDHELGCHTFAHTNPLRTTVEEYEASILKNRTAFARYCPGRRLKSFAYPYGALSLQVKKRVSAHFTSCRGGGQVPNVGRADLNHLRAFFLEQCGDRPQLARAAVDENCRKRGWLIFATHDVGNSPSCTSSNQSRPMSLFRKRDFLPVSRLRRCV